MHTRLKLTFATAALLLAASLGSGPAPRQAAAAGVDVDISVFYTSLAPYGDWVNLDTYGWSFVPENVDFGWRPYTLGQWEWVEPYGWTWVSDESFGWATYHYGRWTYVDDYGWAWVPGTTWGPAWVAFRYGDPWIGWAPLPPGPNWRFDAAFDVAGLNLDVSIGSYAWNFVPVRYFAEPDVRARVYVTAYSPYFMERTRWSTRYAPVDGGFANHSLDLALVERARGAPVARRRFRESTAPTGAGAHRQGDDVVLYRPRITPKAPAQAPAPRARGDGRPGADLDAWTAQRRAALKAHLEAQKKALEQEQPDAVPAAPDRPHPGMKPEDAAKRREAALKAIEDEKARLEAALERQRKRREKDQAQPDPKAPGGMGDDGHGKGDGKGKKDKDKDNDDGGMK